MLYSHKLEDESFLLFTLFINNVLEGKRDYIPKVDYVIREAKELLNGLKDQYSINKENYPLTVFLSLNASKQLEEIDPEFITTNDYRQILKVVEDQSSVVFGNEL